MILNQFEEFTLKHYFQSYPSDLSFTEITLAMNEYAPYTESSKEVIDQLIFREQYEHSSLYHIASSMKLMLSALEIQFIERPPPSASAQILKKTLELLGNAQSVEVYLDTRSGLAASIEAIDYAEKGGVDDFCYNDDKYILHFRVRSSLLELTRTCLNSKFPNWEGSSNAVLNFKVDGSVHIKFQKESIVDCEASMKL